MIELVRTNSTNPDFVELVKLLDQDLAIRDGKDHAFFAQYNKIDLINYVVLIYLNDKPIGCGAIKPYDDTVMEVKRMYTLPEHRGMGYASEVLNELEEWASELGYASCILETGLKMPEAIHLYEKCGYVRIPNYGQYIGIAISVCFEKKLISE